MWIVADDSDACDICGRPALLTFAADTPHPWRLCLLHMPEKWQLIFTMADEPMSPCVVCGAPGQTREVDVATATIVHYCARHTPVDAALYVDGTARTRN
jgi:hypothetical protein